MEKLKPFIVLYWDDAECIIPSAMRFHAEDASHAEEQMLDAEPNATIAWIAETDDPDEAYERYWNSV